MPANYYYLVAGLPELIFDSPKRIIPLSEFVDDIIELVTPGHADLLRLFRLFYDNKNLINILDKKDKDFDSRGNYTKEELEKIIKSGGTLPKYMTIFLEEYKDAKPGDLSSEDRLAWLYYQELTLHSNEFIKEWFTFDLNLRNLLAAVNCRKLVEESDDSTGEFSLSKHIINLNDFSEQILKSRTPDFSLSKEYPWVEAVLSLNRQNLIEFEKNIDLLRWKIADELTVFSYFQIEAIFAFLIKLDSVDRWQRLKPDVGEEMLGRLLAGFKSNENLIKDLQ